MVLPDRNFTDAYGNSVVATLHQIQQPLAEVAERFATHFWEALNSVAQTAEVMARLGPDELSRLKLRQAQHLMMLLSPELTGPEHQAEAQRTGRVHALVGVDVLWLIEAFSLYQQDIHQLLPELVPESAQRELLMRVINRRILLDLEGQVASYRQIDVATSAALSHLEQLVMKATNLPDLVRGALTALSSLEGDVSAFFARADTSGQLQIESSWGVAAERYQQAMEAGKVPKISIDPALPAGQGPGGRAWRSGEIVVSDAWALEQDRKPWRAVGAELGFRSSAAVPLVDAAGQSVALLSLYGAWPGYFSTLRIKGFLIHIQRILSHALQQHGHARVIPLREQQSYLRLLEQRQVVMLYQPIINLRDGSLAKVEALARLNGENGELITPLRFLPAFGADELLRLFEEGLRQACADCANFDRLGQDVQIAINFPAEGLTDPRYEEALFRALGEHQFAPGRLQLEMLETEDGERGDTDLRQAFFGRLRAAGIKIAQDDLGSGHSSLLRMDKYAFDEVKIDQGLVRGALRNPQRALEFMLYLTRLVHAFKTPVTVEGLENAGMIEAAVILGADRGQGYGIARPMPAADLPDWHRSYVHAVDPQNPRTALGAMAGYLLWDLQLAAITNWPNLVEEFAGTNCIVDQFITARQLQGSALDKLLRHNHALALSGPQSNIYQRTRAQVIELLKNYWLSETNP